ncbi:MAG: hypothetical protein MUE39_00800 [Gammaproteobacteria bacterium]|nr:hypothetical protein [Gammaproteobacteria bacterium]
MSIYAQEKLIAQARQLAAEYRRTMGKPLPGISTEIAEFDAMRLLGLVPRPPGEEAGYDAVDPARAGKRIQIKARTIFDEERGGQRVGQLKMGQEWDSVLLVLMDESYEPYEIYEAERADLEEYAEQSGSRKARKGALSVARFKIIGRLLWDRVGGRDAEVWADQAG